jgi:putative ABC transport system substrate-binding protein
MPVVGILSFPAIEALPDLRIAFDKGLAAEGLSEGRNVRIEIRSAAGDAARLPDLAAELVRRKVNVIASVGGPPAALAAKQATSTIPIVFLTGGDPVQIGLVSSLSRPGGNVTGTYFLIASLVPKRIEIMLEMFPQARRLAILVNPANPSEGDVVVGEGTSAARLLGLEHKFFEASTKEEISSVFARIVAWRPDIVVVGPDPNFTSHRAHLVALANRYALPASYSGRQYVEAGGLMSYGPELNDIYRLAGSYVGRILKGTPPAELPVEQPTKFQLAINLKAAKALRIDVPQRLLIRADEVIE